MGGKQERKTQSVNVGSAEILLNRYQRLLAQDNTVVYKFDESKAEDRWLALEIAMRGKTEEDYSSIVDGLFKAHGAEKNKEKKNALLDLASNIMRLGERNLDIDWS